MPELRKDPITRRWVIIATERAARPTDFPPGEPLQNGSASCPFCEGQEGRTPPEIAAVRRPGTARNSPGWEVRVVANKFPAKGLNTWEVNVTQDLMRKAFPLFSLVEGQTYVDYDLIYIFNNMLFNGSKNVDGRAFDRPENRPTNLQIPLVRQP